MAKDYPNRSDLRGGKVPKMAATGQTYGEAGKQMAAQKAVPMGAPQAPPSPVVSQPFITPGQVTDLAGVSNRPYEPISTGMDFGPGPGSEILSPPKIINQQPPVDILGGSQQYLIDQVRSLYSRHPNSSLFQLLLELENQPL